VLVVEGLGRTRQDSTGSLVLESFMDSGRAARYAGATMDEPKKSRPAPRLQLPERSQMKLRAASLDELVSPDHPVRAVWAYVERADLVALYEAIRAVEGAPGRPPIDPKILLALWLYATLDGVGSARELDRLTREHQVYQWICGDVPVNHHTLADFRVDHPELLERLLVRGVAALTSQELVTMKRIAQDGVRVRASAGAASFHREKTLKEHLTEAEEQLRRLADELHEDTQASSRRQKAAQERAAQDREDRVAEALRQLRDLQETKPKEDERQSARASETDPEARVMKMADGGFRPAFNVQFATDVETQIIVGVDVTNVGSDSGQMPPMVDQLFDHYGRAPAEMLVDGGFAMTKAIDQVAKPPYGCTVFGPVQKPKDPTRDPHQPPEGDSPIVADWRVRMGTNAAKAIYKLRGQTAECVNAIARNRGLYRFLVRGLRKVRAIALWFALAHNVNRSAALTQA
jgi:transposase